MKRESSDSSHTKRKHKGSGSRDGLLRKSVEILGMPGWGLES